MLAADALHLQRDRIRRYPITFVAVIIIAIATLCFGYYHDGGHGHATLIHAAGYVLAMWLCAWVIDIFACWHRPAADFPVRQPRKELVITLVCTGIGLLALCVRFTISGWDYRPGVLKLLVAGGIFLFMYPVVLLVIMLLR